MSQYKAAASSEVKPEITEFFEDFYRISDTADAHEQYADFFTDNGKLIMGLNEGTGRDAIVGIRTGMWEKVASRSHRPTAIHPAAAGSHDVMLYGTVDYGLKDGRRADAVVWAARAHFVEEQGRLKMDFYQVYVPCAEIVVFLPAFFVVLNNNDNNDNNDNNNNNTSSTNSNNNTNNDNISIISNTSSDMDRVAPRGAVQHGTLAPAVVAVGMLVAWLTQNRLSSETLPPLAPFAPAVPAAVQQMSPMKANICVRSEEPWLLVPASTTGSSPSPVAFASPAAMSGMDLSFGLWDLFFGSLPPVFALLLLQAGLLLSWFFFDRIIALRIAYPLKVIHMLADMVLPADDGTAYLATSTFYLIDWLSSLPWDPLRVFEPLLVKVVATALLVALLDACIRGLAWFGGMCSQITQTHVVLDQLELLDHQERLLTEVGNAKAWLAHVLDERLITFPLISALARHLETASSTAVLWKTIACWYRERNRKITRSLHDLVGASQRATLWRAVALVAKSRYVDVLRRARTKTTQAAAYKVIARTYKAAAEGWKEQLGREIKAWEDHRRVMERDYWNVYFDWQKIKEEKKLLLQKCENSEKDLISSDIQLQKSRVNNVDLTKRLNTELYLGFCAADCLQLLRAALGALQQTLAVDCTLPKVRNLVEAIVADVQDIPTDLDKASKKYLDAQLALLENAEAKAKIDLDGSRSKKINHLEDRLVQLEADARKQEKELSEKLKFFENNSSQLSSFAREKVAENRSALRQIKELESQMVEIKEYAELHYGIAWGRISALQTQIPSDQVPAGETAAAERVKELESYIADIKEYAQLHYGQAKRKIRTLEARAVKMEEAAKQKTGNKKPAKNGAAAVSNKTGSKQISALKSRIAELEAAAKKTKKATKEAATADKAASEEISALKSSIVELEEAARRQATEASRAEKTHQRQIDQLADFGKFASRKQQSLERQLDQAAELGKKTLANRKSATETADKKVADLEARITQLLLQGEQQQQAAASSSKAQLDAASASQAALEGQVLELKKEAEQQQQAALGAQAEGQKAAENQAALEARIAQLELENDQLRTSAATGDQTFQQISADWSLQKSDYEQKLEQTLTESRMAVKTSQDWQSLANNRLSELATVTGELRSLQGDHQQVISEAQAAVASKDKYISELETEVLTIRQQASGTDVKLAKLQMENRTAENKIATLEQYQTKRSRGEDDDPDLKRPKLQHSGDATEAQFVAPPPVFQAPTLPAPIAPGPSGVLSDEQKDFNTLLEMSRSMEALTGTQKEEIKGLRTENGQLKQQVEYDKRELKSYSTKIDELFTETADLRLSLGTVEDNLRKRDQEMAAMQPAIKQNASLQRVNTALRCSGEWLIGNRLSMSAGIVSMDICAGVSLSVMEMLIVKFCNPAYRITQPDQLPPTISDWVRHLTRHISNERYGDLAAQHRGHLELFARRLEVALQVSGYQLDQLPQWEKPFSGQHQVLLKLDDDGKLEYLPEPGDQPQQPQQQ